MNGSLDGGTTQHRSSAQLYLKNQISIRRNRDQLVITPVLQRGIKLVVRAVRIILSIAGRVKKLSRHIRDEYLLCSYNLCGHWCQWHAGPSGLLCRKGGPSQDSRRE